MVNCSNFSIDIIIDEKNIDINESTFNYFKIEEHFENNIYSGVLSLIDFFSFFSTYPIIKGSKVEVLIKTFDINGVEVDLNYKFIVSKIKYANSYVVLFLVPEYFRKLCVDRYEKVYENSFDEVIKDIFKNEIGLEEINIDKSGIVSDSYEMFNETYMVYILRNMKKLKDISNDRSNYCFFIHKDNSVTCKSVSNIIQEKNNKPISSLTTHCLLNFSIEDNTYDSQVNDGFSVVGYYFDWENGEMKSYDYDITKISYGNNDMLNEIKEYYDESENINNPTLLQLDPIGDIFGDEDENKCEIENYIYRKNFFNIYVNFKTIGVIEYTPMEVVELLISDEGIHEDGINKSLSGKYLINSVTHNFTKNSDYFCELQLVTSVYNEE